MMRIGEARARGYCEDDFQETFQIYMSRSSNSHFDGFGTFGVHPLGCPGPPNTLKRGHQTNRPSQNENCWSRSDLDALKPTLEAGKPSKPKDDRGRDGQEASAEKTQCGGSGAGEWRPAFAWLCLLDVPARQDRAIIWPMPRCKPRLRGWPTFPVGFKYTHGVPLRV